MGTSVSRIPFLLPATHWPEAAKNMCPVYLTCVTFTILGQDISRGKPLFPALTSHFGGGALVHSFPVQQFAAALCSFIDQETHLGMLRLEIDGQALLSQRL
jgi:hypothetical protein